MTSKQCKHFNDPEQWKKGAYLENENGSSIRCKDCKTTLRVQVCTRCLDKHNKYCDRIWCKCREARKWH